MNYTCITGVDGTGKSTLVRERHGDRTPIFVPQYHLSPSLARATSTNATQLRLASQAIEDWSQRCDLQQLTSEKPYALFSGILLAGPVLFELTRQLGSGAKFLLDRDPFFDPLIYFSAYRQMLTPSNAPFQALAAAPTLVTIFREIAQAAGLPTPADFKEQLSVLLGFTVRDPAPDKILGQLRQLLRLPWPQHTYVLTLNKEKLTERLALKHQAQTAEHHESIDWLVSAQERYKAGSQLLPWPATVLSPGNTHFI